nr:hypothetical protein [Saccharothrix obliqua]
MDEEERQRAGVQGGRVERRPHQQHQPDLGDGEGQRGGRGR